MLFTAQYIRMCREAKEVQDQKLETIVFVARG